MSKTELNKLTKEQLEELGREHGVELDRRLTKAKLISQLLEVLEDSEDSSPEVVEVETTTPAVEISTPKPTPISDERRRMLRKINL